MKIKHIKVNKKLPVVSSNSLHASICVYAHETTEASMFLHPIGEQELLIVVKLCKGKSSNGYDGIHMNVVKKVISHIAKPLTYICNTSFETCIFPDNMKVAKVKCL